ncbi:thiolase family protein [Photobacterium swingsii]|uniref:thiolase family protein n=1 Tax=Photobacterium swingsii TaxID=680026 RepID=UPI00352DD60D
MTKPISIIAAKRTPMGSFQGELSGLSAPELGGWAIAAALEQALSSKPVDADISTDMPDDPVSRAPSTNGQPSYDQSAHELPVNEVLMGCVLTAGCGQAPARQAALHAGLSNAIPATTINKVCGSGMKTVMLAFDQIQLGNSHCIVAGGMESMTNAPYLLQNARKGFRLGHQTSLDHLFFDGLQDAFEGHLMGVYGQQTADDYGFTRQQMDEWAIRSAKHALEAQGNGMFMDEIVPIVMPDAHQPHIVADDEHPSEIKLDKIAQLKPVFAKQGTLTAANSSAISDGAAALILMDTETANQQHYHELALMHGHASHARSPNEFTIAPAFACQQLLEKLGWSVDQIDRWEINEAFAVVTQIAIDKLRISADKVNVNGGACALGHPIGASGARILVSLIYALKQYQQTLINQGENRAVYGIASLCIGGGEATAVAIEVSARK